MAYQTDRVLMAYMQVTVLFCTKYKTDTKLSVISPSVYLCHHHLHSLLLSQLQDQVQVVSHNKPCFYISCSAKNIR